mmetsp:Transcript_28688/g.52340  ORF Transcript_28688/g.52340 Transcript_28688/m.52340 type:complete len:786 (-) Transcript_28688:1-2358(-)
MRGVPSDRPPTVRRVLSEGFGPVRSRRGFQEDWESSASGSSAYSGSLASSSTSASGEHARWNEVLSSDDSSAPYAGRRGADSRVRRMRSQRSAHAQFARQRSAKPEIGAARERRMRGQRSARRSRPGVKRGTDSRAGTERRPGAADSARADSQDEANVGPGAAGRVTAGKDLATTNKQARRESAELEARAAAELEAEQESWEDLFEGALDWDPELQEMDLSGQWVGDLGAKQVAAELSSHHSLTTLDLGANDISSLGAEHLAEALTTNASLLDLILTGNNLADEGAGLLARALEVNVSLKTLDLSLNRVGDLGAEEFAVVLKINAVLLDLNLASNQITNQGAYMLTGGLQDNHTLSCLDISRNRIREEGAERLVSALREKKEAITLKLTPNVFGHDLVNLAAVTENLNRSLGTQAFTVTADKSVDQLGFVLCNMPPGCVYIKEVKWGSWAHNQGIRTGNRMTVINDIELISMSAKAFRVQIRRRPLSLQMEPSQNGAPAAGAREALAQEVVATVKDKKLGIIFLNTPPGPVFVDAVESWSWAANMGIENGTTIVAIEGEDTLTLSAETFKVMMQKRPLRLTVLPPQPGLSPIDAWRERLGEAPLREAQAGELSQEEQLRRQQREQERFRLRTEADSRRIAAEAAKRTREEMIAAEDRRVLALRKGPLRSGDGLTPTSPTLSPGGVAADLHSDDGRQGGRALAPADMVDVQLSMLGKVKLVRHAKVTTISLLLAPHERNAGGPLVAKDAYGLELGPEITLGQLAEMRKEGGPLELSLEPDLWAPAG